MSSVKFEGMAQILQKLESLGRDVENVSNEAVLEGAKVLKDEIERTAPKRTGKLKTSININVEGDKATVHTGSAFYAHFLEFGTTKMGAQPFVEPAFYNKKDEIQEKMADVLKRELRI